MIKPVLNNKRNLFIKRIFIIKYKYQYMKGNQVKILEPY